MALPQDPEIPVKIEEDCPKTKGGTGCEWSNEAVTALLNSYVDKFILGKGILRSKDWEEVHRNVNACCESSSTMKTMKQCKDKVDSLKRRYKIEKRKAVNGNSVTWPFFVQMDKMMGSVLKHGKSFEPFDNLESRYTNAPDEILTAVKLDESHSPGECAADNARVAYHAYKHIPDEVDDLSENGGPTNILRHHKRSFTPKSPDVSTELLNAVRMQGYNKRPEYKKHRIADEERVEDLGYAFSTFSEVFARIEIVKMGIFSKMRMEMAKLHKNQRKHKKKRCA